MREINVVCTPWEEVAGKVCDSCGGPATHYYGGVLVCCECHCGGPGEGLVSPGEAREQHLAVLRKRALALCKDFLKALGKRPCPHKVYWHAAACPDCSLAVLEGLRLSLAGKREGEADEAASG